MSIPRKVRDYAKKLAEETCTVTYRGVGVTKHDVRIAQASVRDAYLAGWADHADAMERVFESVYHDPRLRTPELRRAALHKAIVEASFAPRQEDHVAEEGD